MTDGVPQLGQRAAERAIESLRKGIPPTGLVRRFTVGRQVELDELMLTLATPTEHHGSALLIRANYGAGKSHLLQVIREMALEAGYVVGLATIDSQSGVRFNRMDQIFGAICRSLEVPDTKRRGIGALFDHYAQADETNLDDAAREIRDQISDSGTWSFSERLGSPAMFVALRAWVNSPMASRTRDLVADWFSFPFKYESSRRKLYDELVADPSWPFDDPREDWQFYMDGVFWLRANRYDQCWRALADLELLAETSGLNGVILLFDEFEDVIQNLNNRAWQQSAFFNLFHFFAGDRFPGMAYFAVTPEFVVKCKEELQSRYVYEFPFKRFDDLPHFEMSRIRKSDFKVLAKRIRPLHGIAYQWDADAAIDDAGLSAAIDKLFKRSSQDQIRQAIEGLVEALDDALDAEDG